MQLSLPSQSMLNGNDKGPGLVFIGSYVPRKCGIATFTRDLATAVNQQNPDVSIRVIALLDNLSRDLNYPPEVITKIRQEEWRDYQRAANLINNSPEIEKVSLQHEYGIYGGKYGDLALKFMRLIKKPIVTTLHTVVTNPDSKRVKIIQELCRRSAFVVVMLDQAAKILQRDYGVSLYNIAVIPHGVPNFSNFDTAAAKAKLGLSGKIVMSSVNLLSHYKGIEYALQSLPGIVKKVPNFIYQIIGETHPDYLRQLGGVDTYRQHLKRLGEKLGVSKHLVFVNKYLSLEELVGFVEASDFYVTPYIDPDQITSGALAYAIGAGKVCISTPYLYAKEMLAGERGVLVPFGGSREIAEAVVKLIQNPQQMKVHREKTYRVGKFMTWPYVASQYLDLFKLVTLLVQPSIKADKTTITRQVAIYNEIRR